jgi:hypothetical protein
MSKTSRAAAAAGLVLTAFVLAGCSSTPQSVATSASSAPSHTATTKPATGRVVTDVRNLFGRWQVASLGGQSINQDGSALLVHFGVNPNGPGQDWGADDGCNWHSGAFAISSDGSFSAQPGATTTVGCSAPYGDNPDAFLHARELRIEPASGTRPETLLLVGAGRQVLATYNPYPWQNDPSVKHATPSQGRPSSAYLNSFVAMLAYDAEARARADGWDAQVVPQNGTFDAAINLHRLTFLTDAHSLVRSAHNS